MSHTLQPNFVCGPTQYDSKCHAAFARDVSLQFSITLLFKFMKNSPRNKFNKSIKQNHHKFAHENTRRTRATRRPGARNEWMNAQKKETGKVLPLAHTDWRRRATTTTKMDIWIRTRDKRQNRKSNLLQNWMRTDNFVLSHPRSLSSAQASPK